MQLNRRWMVTALVFGGLLAAGAVAVLLLLFLPNPTSETAAGKTSEKNQPAEVERIEGTEFSRVILTAKAAERLDIQTAQVREAEVVRKGAGREPTLRRVIPYGAIVYDTNGNAFVYTNPEPLTFVRSPISVDYIEGDLGILSDGPPSGTPVVTVGVPELYGAEFGVGY